MQNLIQQHYIRPIGFFIIALLVLAVSFNKLLKESHVFSVEPSYEPSSLAEQYFGLREKRNKVKMKESYLELMQQGFFHSEEGDWKSAIPYFFYAKTIFGEKVEPRKQLCYGYLKMCQSDWRYCDKAKKELYYAMKYVDPMDEINYEYLKELVVLVDMEEIVEMNESEALLTIF